MSIESGFAPVQWNGSGGIPAPVHMRAYEVYKHCYGEQQALCEGWCRGGFSAGELIALLYAYPFPREEWRARVNEAIKTKA